MKMRIGIAAKIIGLVAILEVIANVLLILSLNTINDNKNAIEKLYIENLQGTRYSLEMRLTMANCATALQNSIINADVIEDVRKYRTQFEENYEATMTAAEKYEPTMFNEEERTFFAECIDLINRYNKGASQAFALLEQGLKDEADRYVKAELISLRNTELLPLLTKLTDFNTTAAEQQYTASEAEIATARRIIYLAIIIADLFALILAISITLSITKPVKHAVTTLSDSSHQMESSSSELSESSQEIANGAQEQASGIEETTASMEELSSMVQQNLANAKEASVLSEKAANESQAGFEKMNDMLAAMNEITKSTEEIHNVIDVIDDIAFQTNMLALNASVEAARAGEAGMGFAVVADEVKNLANRSAESAKETAAMIKQTLANVESGRKLSEDLSEIFKDMLSNSKKVMEMNREVETASKQQEEGIGQVSKAMIQFDTVVQENASSAEETASAAEEMHSQVQTLEEIVTDLFLIVSGHEHQRAAEPAISATRRAVPVKSRIPEKRKIEHKPAKALAAHTEEHTISFEDDEEFSEK